jgi:tetratricopeptide (TPR) repeat protein
MRSEKLGSLFELAATKILKEAFHCWGYEVLDWKAQSSGSQHGFDLFYRISKEQVRLNIFIECKASTAYNLINSRELTRKIEQLSWAGFPEKDVHLFFSPTRAISFDNELLTIEDDSHPFVIINWMRREGEISPLMELFGAYRSYGADSDILEYCELLFSELDSAFIASRNFEEVCVQLKHDLERRIAEHSARVTLKDYRIINGAFWSQIKAETQVEYLPNYYTRTDSTPARLRESVANDFYVRNEALDREFETILSQAIKEKTALIKILSKGGEGKSTFLYHVAKTRYEDAVLVWLESVETDVLADIEPQLRRLNTERPIIFLLDNAAVYGKALAEFAQKLTMTFRSRALVLVLAEREFRYTHIEDLQEFESVFNETHTINYRANQIRNQVFDRLISYLQTGDPIPHEVKDGAKTLFLEDMRKSLTERTFSVIRYLKTTNQLRGYKFDWDDWEDFTNRKAPTLQRLYLVLATFYQFGFSLDRDFCASFLKDADAIDINTALRDNPNLPIYRRGHHLLLRHETIASWYLDGTNETTTINRRNSEEVFKTFLESIDTPFSRNLFIWLCIKSLDFRRSYLAQYVNDENRISVLEAFIEQTPSELKCRTELSKIYQYQKKWKEAEAILLESLTIDPEQLHPRTELSKIYQYQKKWKEAEDILLELKRIDPDNLQARTELSKIYQYQKKWKEAEDILLELKRIDPDNLQARTELSKIYQYQKKWKEAEDILLELKRIDPDNLQARTELSKIYQYQKKWKEGEDILLECLEINPDDLESRTELSKTYQKQGRLVEAENLLRECLDINPEDRHSLLELGKMRSRDANRYAEAEQLFQLILSFEPDNLFAKLELANLYLKMRRFGPRESILFEIYDTHPEDTPTLMALARVFIRFRKYRIALRLLECALERRQSNLITISELIRMYLILHDNENVRRFLSRGRQILKQDPLNKHRDRFLKIEIEVELDENIELLHLDEVGLFIREKDQVYVENNGERYLITAQATVNNKLGSGDKVFYAVYARHEQTAVDFVEPYFDNIDHLDQLK